MESSESVTDGHVDAAEAGTRNRESVHVLFFGSVVVVAMKLLVVVLTLLLLEMMKTSLIICMLAGMIGLTASVFGFKKL